MRQSQITLTLHDSTIAKGQAIDLITENKSEYVCLKNKTHDNKRINLLDIDTLEIDDKVIHVS